MIDMIREQGFTPMKFNVNHNDMRRATELGNLMISRVIEGDSKLADTLKYNVSGDGPASSSTSFSVGEPLVSKDDSAWLHTGWQSLDRFRNNYGPNEKPPEVVEFFDVQREILSGVSDTWVEFFRQIHPDGPKAASDIISLIERGSTSTNNHHLRIVRYPSLSSYSDENPTFSAHGDMSLVTSHLFETHSGHLRIAPMPINSISNDPLTLRQRAEQAEALRKNEGRTASCEPDEVITFLGFSAASYCDPSGIRPFADTSAAYHFGNPPETEEPIDDKVKADFGDNARVAMVAFGHPNTLTPHGRYQTAQKEACRPEQMLPQLREALLAN